MTHVTKGAWLFTLATIAIATTASAETQERAAEPKKVADGIAALAPVSGGLTADEVAKRATATSFELRAKGEAVRAAQAQLDQAIVNYFPRVLLTGRYTRLSKVEYPSLVPADGPFAAFADELKMPTPPLDQWHTQASFLLPISDYVLRISRSYAAASKSVRAAKLDERAQKLKTALDARLAYYDWLRARGGAEVAEQALELARGHRVDVQHVFQAGSASKADVLRVEAQVAQAEMLVERARNFAHITEDRLRVLMHDTSRRPYTVGEDLGTEVVVIDKIANIDALREEAMSRRLEVKMLEEGIGAIREKAKVERAGVWPRLEAFANTTYANPNQRIFPQTSRWDFTWEAGVQLTWSPNEAFVSGAAGSQASAEAAQLEAQRSMLLDGIRMEVLQASQAVHEAEVAIAMTARGLEAAEESYRVRRELFRNGRATSIELTDAETELFRARLEALNARVDLRSAKARLEHAVGRDVEGG